MYFEVRSLNVYRSFLPSQRTLAGNYRLLAFFHGQICNKM